MDYKIFASLHQDINEGWVWISPKEIKDVDNFSQRSIIKITTPDKKHKIYCECLLIDENFLNRYKKTQGTINIKDDEIVIVINEWYRKQLGGIQTQETQDLTIEKSNNFYGKFRSNLGHPQVVVRLATKLAAISVLLGSLSLILAIISLSKG